MLTGRHPSRADEDRVLRVGIIANLEQATGIYRYSRALLTELPTVRDSPCVCAVTFAKRDLRPSWLPAGVAYRRTRIPGRIQVHLQRQLHLPVEVLYGLRVDLVHAIDLHIVHTHRPIIRTVYDVAWRRVRGYDSVVTKGWMKEAERAIRNADHVCAISEATASELIADGYPSDRITVTRLGVDEDFLAVGEEEAKRVASFYRLPERYVLYVGAVNVRKNVGTLLAAVENLPGNFKLVGVGPRTTEAGSLAQATDRWMHLGFVPAADMPGLYRAATAVVAPSTLEGFGLVVLEAMATGATVIASDIPPHREVAGDTVIYFAPHDVEALTRALTIVLASPAQADRNLAARRRASHFSWRACAEATAEAYRRTVHSISSQRDRGLRVSA